MSKINLLVQFEKETLGLNLSKKDFLHYTKWVSDYNHGLYDDKIKKIICNSMKDFNACLMKAKHDRLIPVISSPDELQFSS